MNDQPNVPNVSTTGAARLRIWPAVLCLALVAVAKGLPYVISEMSPSYFTIIIFAPLVAGVGLLVWWMFFSRAKSPERWLGPAAVVAVVALSYLLAHPTIQGMGYFFFVLPMGVLAVGAALLGLAWAKPNTRTWGAILAALAGFMSWNLLRNDGVWGDFQSSLAWRWQPTAEERFLASLKSANDSRAKSTGEAKSSDEPAGVVAAGSQTPLWPEFRGPHRDGSVPGIVLETDWTAHPPKEIWRRPIGPGWSSFAVDSRSVYTQEQRGDVEVVACYDADTGEQRWVHETPGRFWEAVAGAGPRATPTLAAGKVFAVGATGKVHCLDPATGSVVWQRDLAKDAGREAPMWGFSSSPLVVGDLVIVYAGGSDNKGLFAYDINTGEPRWQQPAGDHSYSSPQLTTIGGREVVLMLTNTGISAIDPAKGETVWNYAWQYDGYRALQPLVVDGSSVVLGTGMGTGTRRIDLETKTADTTDASESAKPEFKDTWTSMDMKPDFNDYVAHKGNLYGFDHNIFGCIDLATGKRHWKKGRYGNGQVLLLPDADQLLILTEPGEIVLLRANEKELEELARKKVLNDKTWNHPVLVGNRLYVRNAEEAVCLELPLGEKAGATE